MYDVKLRPIYYASVSGGKDSLYMLKLILSMPEVYDNFMNMVEKWEIRFGCNYFQSQSKYNVDYVRNIVDKKYIPQLLSEE